MLWTVNYDSWLSYGHLVMAVVYASLLSQLGMLCTVGYGSFLCQLDNVWLVTLEYAVGLQYLSRHFNLVMIAS